MGSDADHARAITCLRALVALLERIGGYLPPEDQITLRAARVVLMEAGKYQQGDEQWNRTPQSP